MGQCSATHIQPIKFLGKGGKIPSLTVATSRTIFDLCNTRGRVGEEVDTVVSLCSLKPVALISKYSCERWFSHGTDSRIIWLLLLDLFFNKAFYPTAPHQWSRGWVIPPRTHIHVGQEYFALQAPRPAHFSCWSNPVAWEEKGRGRLASSSDSSLLLNLNSFVLMHTWLSQHLSKRLWFVGKRDSWRKNKWI